MLQLTELEILMDTPASRIQYIMDEEKLNQTELAEKIGKSRGLVSSYLNSENKPSDIFLRTLEDKLGWSARWIRTGLGPKRVQPGTVSDTLLDKDNPYIRELEEVKAKLKQALEVNERLKKENELHEKIIKLMEGAK